MISIQRHLQSGEFAAAQKLLEHAPENEQTFCCRSLLHRCLGEYAEDRTLIIKAHALYSENIYIKQRWNWYHVPLLGHLLPRQPLRLSSKSHKTPTPETLAQMCFVTSGSSNQIYFDLLIQQIESIKATVHYANVSICILDAGLTPEQKNILTAHFDHLTIKDPLWDLEMPKGTHPVMKNAISRAFIDLHFPEYRYYMWLQNDSWVQDENSIHDFLYQARINGAGLVLKEDEKVWTKHNLFVKSNALYKRYPQSYDTFLNKRRNYTCAVFCIDKKTGFFDTWRQTLKSINEFILGHEEVSFVYSVHTCKALTSIKPLDHTHWFGCENHGLPVLGPIPDILYSPSTFKPLGLLSLNNDLITSMYAVMPMHKATGPLTPEMLRINQVFYRKIAPFCQTHGYAPDLIELMAKHEHSPLQLASYHYRSWPPHDKAQALSLLQDFFTEQQPNSAATAPSN